MDTIHSFNETGMFMTRSHEYFWCYNRVSRILGMLFT
jgi:hypothetical protein